jgi:hypothetical protein
MPVQCRLLCWLRAPLQILHDRSRWRQKVLGTGARNSDPHPMVGAKLVNWWVHPQNLDVFDVWGVGEGHHPTLLSIAPAREFG